MNKFKGFFSSLYKNKKIFIPIALLVIGLIVIFALRAVSASNKKIIKKPQTKQSNTKPNDTKSSTVKGSDNKKGPNQKALSRTRTKPAKNLSETIALAKKNKRINDEQAKKIEDKVNELKKFNDSMKDKDDSELMKLVGEKKRELRDWARQNEIPTYFVNFMVNQ